MTGQRLPIAKNGFNLYTTLFASELCRIGRYFQNHRVLQRMLFAQFERAIATRHVFFRFAASCETAQPDLLLPKEELVDGYHRTDQTDKKHYILR